MAQITVSLPDELQHWADARVVERGFGTASDYVGDLVRQDQEYAVKLAALQAAIDAGLASPETDATIDDIIARGLARHKAA